MASLRNSPSGLAAGDQEDGGCGPQNPSASAWPGGLPDRKGRRTSALQGMQLIVELILERFPEPPPPESAGPTPAFRCVRLGAETVGQPSGPPTPTTVRQYMDIVRSC